MASSLKPECRRTLSRFSRNSSNPNQIVSGLGPETIGNRGLDFSAYFITQMKRHGLFGRWRSEIRVVQYRQEGKRKREGRKKKGGGHGLKCARKKRLPRHAANHMVVISAGKQNDRHNLAKEEHKPFQIKEKTTNLIFKRLIKLKVVKVGFTNETLLHNTLKRSIGLEPLIVLDPWGIVMRGN